MRRKPFTNILSIVPIVLSCTSEIAQSKKAKKWTRKAATGTAYRATSKVSGKVSKKIFRR
jgi:hypothetical protein